MRLFILIFLATVALPAFPQPYYFRHYQVENGLSNNTVFASVQDNYGFLWFGTKDGLNRFDGYHFKVFNLPNEDERTLERYQVSSLLTDEEGAVWIGSQNGLYRFDQQTESIVHVIDTLSNVTNLFRDKEGLLWFLADFTACRFDVKKNKLTVFPSARYFPATSICQSPDGAMWFTSWDGTLIRFDVATNRFKQYSVFSHSPPAASYWINKILSDGKGSIFIGTNSQGIKQFDIASGTYKDLLTHNKDKSSLYVRDIIRFAENEIWFGTESGILIYRTDEKKFTALTKKFNDPYSLSDNAVYTLYKDAEGGIWAGTYFGGVNYYPRQHSLFDKYFPYPQRNTISGSVVREIAEDRYANLWIATEDAGLNKLDTKTGVFTHYTPQGVPTSISYSNIHALLPVEDDLWVGTFEHGLDILDIRTGKVKKHFSSGPGPYDLKSNFIVSLLRTREGEIYLATSSGLYRFLPARNGFDRIDLLPENTFVSSLLQDRHGTVWVGTHKGVYFFHTGTKKEGGYLNQPNNKNSLTSNTINALYEDSLQQLWIATEGGGLCRLNAERDSFTRYTTKNGLPSNFIFKVLEDGQKQLWITSSKGLVKLDPRSGAMSVYTKENGLLNDQFNYNSGYKSREGKLCFGSVKGLICFDPSTFVSTQFISPVYLTGFQVHHKELPISKDSSALKQSILFTEKITLPYDQSSFSIDFAALSFTAPERTEYSYFMQGLDKEWTSIKWNRKVYFTNLSPGEYTFRVKAASNGIWCKKERQLLIRITPPLWATPWAYFIYVLAGGILLYYLVSSYHRLQEDKKEKEIYEAKFEFFTNVAHEIKTPLTLIKGPVENLSEWAEVVPEIKEDIAMMERNTARLMNLVNQILDFRQTETKGFSLNFDKVNVSEVLTETFETFQPVAKKRKLAYTLELPSQPVHAIADGEALLKIFSNLLSNATKYANNEVSVRLHTPQRKDQHIFVEVQNDGYLIPEEMKEKIFEPFFRLQETVKQKGTGIGLALARSLAELHKGSLTLSTANKLRNTFLLSLPLTADQQAWPVTLSERKTAQKTNE